MKGVVSKAAPKKNHVKANNASMFNKVISPNP